MVGCRLDSSDVAIPYLPKHSKVLYDADSIFVSLAKEAMHAPGSCTLCSAQLP